MASVSHVGTVQLAVATGLLPRNVEVPEWIRYGIGSYAETPKGAYWNGVGSASWKHLVRWKVWRRGRHAGDRSRKKRCERSSLTSISAR